MAIAHVQTAVGNTNSGNPSVTFAAAPTQGNMLIASAEVSQTAANTVVNTGWTRIGNKVESVDTLIRAYKLAGAGESTTQTPFVVSGTLSARCLVVGEYSGVEPNSPLEATTDNIDDDATKTTTGTCDPTDSVERLTVGAVGSDGNRTASGQKVNGSTTGVNVRGTMPAGNTNSGSTITQFDIIQASTVTGNYTAESLFDVTDNGAASVQIFQPPLPAVAPQRTLVGVGI